MRSTERARLRQQQRRGAEAIADLREADAIYARLKLDFNRIDTSSALALALLAAGDVPAADGRGRRRGRYRNPHPREIGEPRDSSAFPVRELCAVRGPYRGRISRRFGVRATSRQAGKRFASPRRSARGRWRTGIAHVSTARTVVRDVSGSTARADDGAAGRARTAHASADNRRRRSVEDPRRQVAEVRSRLEARMLAAAGSSRAASSAWPESLEDDAGRAAGGYRRSRILRRRPPLACLVADALGAAARHSSRTRAHCRNS